MLLNKHIEENATKHTHWGVEWILWNQIEGYMQWKENETTCT